MVRTNVIGFVRILTSAIVVGALSALGLAQSLTFGGDAYHSSVYPAAAQDLNRIKWSTTIDQNNTGAATHYGAPLITANNTVITPVKIANNAFQVEGLNASDGSIKYTLSTDYVLPSYDWIPVYQPVVANGPNGPRLWYPGIGGSLFYVDNIDSTPTAPTRVVFYSSGGTTNSDTNSTVFVDTPITADGSGNVYFGFRTQGTSSTLGTTQSGYAKIDTNGNGTWRLVGDITSDSAIGRDSHNAAPALSVDGSLLYVVTKGASTEYYGYLAALNTSDLTTAGKIFLTDPRNGNPARILDASTASPMVGPDGDVYFGIFGNPYNGSRGFLAHFNSTLTTSYPMGGFGWDSTAAIVPKIMVPSYTGSSSYLLFCKYNNYNINDGNGQNRVAILDPHSTQIDFHSSAPGLVEMRTVLSMLGPTPDSEYASTPNAVREWCVNTGAVNPATNSVYFDSEDGHIYKWDLVLNQMTQSIALTSGIGEPYVPTTIGPDGAVYTLNGGNLFALGNISQVSMQMSSSSPDATTNVANSSITFTASVTSGLGSPTGNVTFTDLSYSGLTPVTTTLASNVPLDASGHASVTTANLAAGGSNLGSHFITASYSGDANFPADNIMLVQKVHAAASTTTLSSSANPSNYGGSITLTANVTSTLGTPVGYVTFSEGTNVIGQIPLDGSGNASFTPSTLSVGNHSFSAHFVSDTQSAASTGSLTELVNQATSTAVTASPTSATFGQSVTFTATVSSTVPGAGTPTGSVSFFGGGRSFGTAPVNGSGQASVTVSNLLVGVNHVTGTFSGNAGWQGSSGNAPDVTVSDATSTALSATPNPSTYGQTVTLTATVTAADSGAGTPAGTVSFADGSTSLGSSPVDASGHATFSISSLAVGSHSISASFAGTTGWGASSGSASQLVQDGTTTSLTSSPNPSTYSQSVTLTATVSASDSGAGTPSGTVTFADGSTTLGSAAVDASGHASISTSALAVGSHSISASFAGATGWLTSAGSASQSVQDGTNTSLNTSPNPSTYGQTVTLTATVTPADSGAGNPTGTVTFTSGGGTFGSAAVNGSGQASITVSSLSVGSHSITASFAGTAGYLNSSGSATQSVQDGTSTSLSSSPNPSSFGQSVTITATVAPADSGAGAPTGSVSFSDGGTSLGSATVDGSGHASISVSSLSVGSHSLTAAFTGTGGYLNSSGSESQSVQDATSTTVSGSPNPSSYGQTVTLTATVSAADSGAGTPTGSVTFNNGGGSLGTAAVDGTGRATLTVSTLSVGAHSITAAFSGTGGWQNSSGGASQTVQSGTTTTVSGSPNPSNLGQPAVFTAVVGAAIAGAGTPSGTVTFSDGGATLGSAPVDASGHATFTTSSLSRGVHTITATFGGVVGWLSSSGTTSQTVQDLTPPTVPSGVTAVGGPGKGQITVSWAASTDPDDTVAHYEVWRSTKANGSFTLATTVTGLSFVDSAGKGQTRYYFVVAVDTAGNRSGNSAVVSAKAP